MSVKGSARGSEAGGMRSPEEIVQTLAEPHIERLEDISLSYVRLVNEIFGYARDGQCSLSKEAQNMSEAERLGNMDVYLKKLSYRYYQLLSRDLKEILDTFSDTAVNREKFKQFAIHLQTEFDQTEKKHFSDKTALSEEGHIKRLYEPVEDCGRRTVQEKERQEQKLKAAKTKEQREQELKSKEMVLTSPKKEKGTQEGRYYRYHTLQ
jgi:hypothetical protein